jgi:hypothetical protein
MRNAAAAGPRHYLAALAVLIAALLRRALFDAVLGDRLGRVTSYGAVAFAVWIGGIGAAVLTRMFGYVAADCLALAAMRAGWLPWILRGPQK